MATGKPKDAICRIVKHGILELETEAGRKPVYNGVLMIDGMLIVVDSNEYNLEIYNGHDGTRITSHRLKSYPTDVCLISKNEVAVCLLDGTVVILSLKSIDDVKLVKTLKTEFYQCHSLAKWDSDKLVISGRNYGVMMLCWGILSITDGRMDSTQDICKGYRTNMAVKDNTLYISCLTFVSINKGVYVYDLSNPQTLKFLYRHQELKIPWSIMADRDYVYVCDFNSNRIHQLTDSGQLVTIYTVSSIPYKIFYDGQHGLLYTTSYGSNVITVYKMESLNQQDPLLPVEILSMDSNSIQLYKKALHAGKEKVYNIRVMVVGQFGVGKTTLIKRLLGQQVDIAARKSTEGIDVHKHCCKISLDKGEWIQQHDDSDQLYTLHRLKKLLSVPDQKPDISQEQDDIGKVIYQREITSEIDSTKSNGTSTTSVSDQEVQSSTQVSITRGDEIHHVEHLDKETGCVAVPLSDAKSSDSEKTKDAMMEILRLVNENADRLVKDIEKYAALSIWDFAGQFAFYTTHQMFLTSRAIYLLVIDLSQQITDLIQDDKCFLDADGIKLRQVLNLIQIWMNSIHSSVASPEAIIPVILVGTHVDKLSEKSRKEVIDKYFKELRYMLREKPNIRHLMDDIAIDNTLPDPMLEELKKRIFELSSKQPHWGEERPARWLPLEQAIMTLKASGRKVVQLSLIEKINMSGSVKIEDRNELELFLKFHHEMGTILYFSVEELRKKIVLDPQWMIDALKSLITAETFIKKNPAITSKLYEFIKTGKLTHELIDVIWTKENNPEFHNNKDHILGLMEQLNIIAMPRIYSKEGSETKEERYFLAPCMLQHEPPEEIISPKQNSQIESSPVLCYVFTGNFLPSAIFHRLVAACIAHWPVAKKKKEHVEENLIFCGCCVFKLDEQQKLTLHFREHVIFLRVTRMGIKDKTPSSKLCIEVREFITRNLLKIIGYLGQGLKFEYFIQCPEYSGVSINSLIPVSRFETNAEVHCEFHDHMIESCKVLDFWFEDQVKNIHSQDKVDVDTPITQEHINHARLCNALTTACSNALREILLTNIPMPHPDIDKAILANKVKLNKLNKDQAQLVFPDPQGLSTGKQNIDSVEETCLSTSKQTIPEECQKPVQERALPPRKKYHVFFSYASPDIQWVKKTVKKLEKDHGFICCEYDRDNIPGTQLMTFADDSIRHAYKTVLVMTREAFENGFVIHEIQMAMIHGFIEKRNCIVPVLVEDCEIPGYLKVINYVDARDSSKSSTWWPKLLMELEYEANTDIHDQVLPQAHNVRAMTKNIPNYQFKGVPCSDPKLLCQLLQTSQQAASASQSTLEANCLSVGLELHGETPADGNCFFEAVSSQLQRLNCVVQKSPQQLRQEVVTFMRDNRVIQASEGTIHLDSFIYNESFDVYCSRMARDSEWADHVVVVTMARMLQIDIMIVTSSPSSGPENIVWVVGKPAFQEDPILLGHVWESHYMSLQPIGSTTTIMQASSLGSKLSTTTGSVPCPTFTSTTANLIPAPTSASTTDIMQSPSSGSTTNATQDPSSGSTSANVIQTPTSGSTAAHILQSTASGSKPSTFDGLTPVNSSCYTAGGLQLQASSSIQSTTADVTQAPSLDDTGRFVHIACLLVNVGSKVLRRLLHFHTVTPTCTLDQYLAKKRIDIDNLRKRKILNKSQMDILFPPGGSTKLGDYDITLLSTLFTNIVLTISQQNQNMIQFLRDKRNEIFAHAKSVTVNSNDYQTFWNDICSTLEALSKQCNDPDFENEISREIQGIQVSTVQGTSLLDALQTHRKMETLERLVQYLMSSHAQESNKESDNSDS